MQLQYLPPIRICLISKCHDTFIMYILHVHRYKASQGKVKTSHVKVLIPKINTPAFEKKAIYYISPLRELSFILKTVEHFCILSQVFWPVNVCNTSKLRRKRVLKHIGLYRPTYINSPQKVRVRQCSHKHIHNCNKVVFSCDPT